MRCRQADIVATVSWPVSLTLVKQLIAGVVRTGNKHKVANISANLRKNSQCPQWDTQRPGRNWFTKKSNLNSKISCRTPFKIHLEKCRTGELSHIYTVYTTHTVYCTSITIHSGDWSSVKAGMTTEGRGRRLALIGGLSNLDGGERWRRHVLY